MTRPVLLVVPDALRDVAGTSAFERVMSGWRPMTRRDDIRVIKGPIGITLAETQATIALLADGGYRPRHAPLLRTGAIRNEMVETIAPRMRRLGHGVARSLGASSARVRPLHAPAIAWDMIATDGESSARFRDVGTLLDASAAMTRGRIVDEATLIRIDEAMQSVAAIHMGSADGISVSLPTPWSPTRIWTSNARSTGTSMVDWRSGTTDPDIDAMLPVAMVVDGLRWTVGPNSTPRIVMRPVSGLQGRTRGVDIVQALRIVAELERDPIA